MWLEQQAALAGANGSSLGCAGSGHRLRGRWFLTGLPRFPVLLFPSLDLLRSKPSPAPGCRGRIPHALALRIWWEDANPEETSRRRGGQMEVDTFW